LSANSFALSEKDFFVLVLVAMTLLC
jgi:hypothetical protein